MRLENRSTASLYCGDVVQVLKTLPSETFNCCITSPPYYRLRDYGLNDQIGTEETPEFYIERLVAVFREVRRLLRKDGTLWVNIGDSYVGSGKGRKGNEAICAGGKQRTNKGTITGTLGKTPATPGLKHKDLIGIPWMLAFALRADGWYLRSEVIWHKPNPMPESVTDRPTRAHEQLFLLTRSDRYYYAADAIKEPLVTRLHRPGCTKLNRDRQDSGTEDQSRIWGSGTGKNKRSVWTIVPSQNRFAHFATFPPELPETCLLAGSPEGGVVLDPFSGAATTGIVAVKNRRSYVGVELNPEYVEISRRRFQRELGINVDCADLRGRKENAADSPVQRAKSKLVHRTSRCAFTVQKIRLDLDPECELHAGEELRETAELVA
jgi:DNA modification methylase